MRFLKSIAFTALLGCSVAAQASDIPIMGIGLPYTPEAPRPLSTAHALYQRVEVAEIEGLPPTVKSSALNFIAAAKRSSINKGLRESLQRMNMLAPDAASARTRLTVSWGGSETPLNIGGWRRYTKVTFHYRLARIDNGQVLFDRSITTTTEGRGIDAVMVDNGIVRAAIAANFASAVNCMDRTAYGTAPADCALTPLYSVSVTRRR